MAREAKCNGEHYFEDEFGQIQGEFKSWHKNGQPRIHCYFVDGKVHGEYKQWYPNGQLERHCYYVDGKLHGEYKWWNENGQLFLHFFYVDNKVFIDFFKDPVTDEAKANFALKYGSAKLLPNN
jgi:antitoxin component YwqK of YwqJK toxin-antitoxin module